MKSLIGRLLNKPEWQHPDPTVRAEAVLRLPSSEHETLLAIAREDEEPRVRRAATRKLADTQALSDLLRSDPDETVREEAASRLVHVVSHATEEGPAAAALEALTDPRHLATVGRTALLRPIREAAIGAIKDPRALATIVREAEDGGTRLLALGRIDDAPTLLSMALKSDQKPIAVAAVDRLTDEEALREVAESARLGAASRRAKARLPQDDDRGTPAPPPTLSEEDDKEREAYERAREEQAREAMQRSEALEARTRLCEAVESAEGEAIPTAIERSRASWDDLAPLVGGEADEAATRFERALEAAGQRHTAYRAGVERRTELATLVSQAEAMAAEEKAAASRAWHSLRKQWKELSAAADQPDLRARFEEASARIEARERSAREEAGRKDQENLARLAALAEKAEALGGLKEAALRDVDHVSRDIRAALDHPGHFPTREDREHVLARLEAARKALYPRLQQLREDAEWKRWANVSVQEDLCARAEALVDEEDLPTLARKLKDLDARWRQARQAPKEKTEELWQRFKTARDAVKGRVDEYFAQQARELAENLDKKEALCEKAEALAESTDWIKTSEELRRLQGEWKKIGPVPRARSRGIWARFRKPCDHFFTRWHEHRDQRSKEWAENLAAKEALCEKAEAVMDSTDWEETAAVLKGLQAEWRAIGGVKKSRSEVVWRRFRKACDHFFDRYKHRDSVALQAVQEARERICVDLESLLPADEAEASPPEDLVNRVLAAQTAWRQAGELPRDTMAALEERFSGVRNRLVERYSKVFAGSELDPEASRRKAEKLVARVEGFLEQLAPEPEPSRIETTEELAARLKDALASNTIGGREAEEARWAAATTEVEAAQAAWRRLGPMPGPEGAALAERFSAACSAFFERRPEPRREERPRRSPRARRPTRSRG